MNDIQDQGGWHQLALSRANADLLIAGLYRLARKWLERDEPEPAEKLLRMIISIDDDAGGASSASSIAASVSLGQVMKSAERFLEAEQLFLRAINRCMQSLKDEHFLFVLSLEEYADLLRRMGMDYDAVAVEARLEIVRHQSIGRSISGDTRSSDSHSSQAPGDSGVMSTITIT